MKADVRKWALLTGAITAEVTGTLALRAMVDAAGWISVVIVAYTAAFALLGLALRSGMPIAVAYGIWGACGVALVALFGTMVFGESMSFPSIIGILVILAGVVLVEAGTHQRPPETGKSK